MTPPKVYHPHHYPHHHLHHQAKIKKMTNQGQQEDYHHRAGKISDSDLVILRQLSISPGGFSQPGLLYDRLQDLSKTHKDLLPPSKQLCRALDSSVCHRKFLWSFVLGIPLQSSRKNENCGSEMTVEHRDERQVELDINRSFVYYPKHISDPDKQKLRETLSQIIVKILRRFPKLNYFQGYHDIVSIFLLNFLDLDNLSIGSENDQKGEKIETYMGEGIDNLNDLPVDNTLRDEDLRLLEETVQKFTLHRIRDSLTSDLSPIMGYLRFTQVILQKEKPRLASLISQTSSLPLFSLSWILTLTSHDLTSLDVVSRVFDFLLCHPPVMICYLACAICLTKTDEIERLASEAEAEGSEIDLDMVHFVMSSLPPLTMDQPEGSPSKPEPEPSSLGSRVKAPTDEVNRLSLVVASPPPSENLADIDRLEEHRSGAEKGQGSADVHDEERVKEDPDRRETVQVRSKAGVSIEEVIRSALTLYETYRPIDPKLKLEKIMGPKSCIYTWSDSQAGRLSDQQAQDILDLPLCQIVRPLPSNPSSKKKLSTARSKLKFSISKLKNHLMKIFRHHHHPQILVFTTAILIAILALRLYSIPPASRSCSSFISFLMFHHKPNRILSVCDVFLSLQNRLSTSLSPLFVTNQADP